MALRALRGGRRRGRQEGVPPADVRERGAHPSRAPAGAVPERGTTPAPLYAFGAHDAIGFSPFGIESIGDPAAKHLAASYDLVAQLEPLLVELQGRGMTAGLLSEGEEQRQPQQVRLNGYVLVATFERGTPPAPADGVLAPTGAAAGPPPPSGGLVLATAPDKFVVAGTAVTITFAASVPGRRVGILSAEEGRFASGRWEGSRRLNGDETHQGRHVRLEPGRFSIQRVRLY